MQSTPHPPEDAGSAKRRPLFGGRAGNVPQIAPTLAENRIQEALEEYQSVLERRLDEGLAAIHSSAVRLMREIASEMWRTSGGDVSDAQSRIVQLLSRDQALKSLIATSDERFQSLTLRSERLQDTVAGMTESNARLSELIQGAASRVSQLAESSPAGGVESIRAQLEQVEHHLAATMQYIGDRDRTLVEDIQAQIREHAGLVAHETERIVEAVQLYVKDGVDTMGRLAQRVEQHMDSIGAQDGPVAERVTEALTTTIGEQLQMIYERLAMEARTVVDALSAHETWVNRTVEGTATRVDEHFLAQAELVRDSARLAAGEVNRTLETRVMGLAQLIRSDSEALRHRLVEAAAAQDEAMARMLDDRLVRVTEAVNGATRWTAEETTRRIGEVTKEAVEGHISETVERSVDGLRMSITAQMDRLDGDLGGLRDHMSGVLAEIAPRAAVAADAAVAARFEATTSKITDSLRAMESAGASLQSLSEETQEAVGSTIDQRVGALAKMIRSDNQILAEQMRRLAEQDPAKQTLRAVKELHAGLAGEMAAMLERKFSVLAEDLHRETRSITETVAHSNETLSQRMDRVASTSTARASQNRDVQAVMQRMGDAMHALASMNRESSAEGRIELE